MLIPLVDRLRIEPRPEFAKIVRPDPEFATPDHDGSTNRINGSFDRLVAQSGVAVRTAVILRLCILAAIVAGGVVYVWRENLLVTAIFVAIGAIAPIAVLMMLRANRQARILAQLPETLDELARVAQAGRNFGQCLEVVAADSPSPLGEELQLVLRRYQLGIPIVEALDDLPSRTGLASVSMLVAAVTIQNRAGANLSIVLERLAAIVRERLTLIERERTAMIASKAFAVLMLSLPPLVFAIFVLRDADYLSSLAASPWAVNMTLLALALQLVGTYFSLRILNHRLRTRP
jgi:tight adherence protein B